MRNYDRLDAYLDDLAQDIYSQPPDDRQLAYAAEVIDQWLPKLPGLTSALDVGCGQGQHLPLLTKYARRVEGVTLGEDYRICAEKGLQVREADMSFLPYERGEFGLIFARHIVEHSPMPLLTLMEWRRVAARWLILITPSLDTFKPYGRNHYYVLLAEQWETLLNRAGWNLTWYEDSPDGFEHRFFCEVT